MADSLQEEEAEIHLASSIQHNYVDEYHLQVAKLWDEKDLKTQTQCQKRCKDLRQKD